jgi:glucose/arabinose dehydrogenase
MQRSSNRWIWARSGGRSPAVAVALCAVVLAAGYSGEATRATNLRDESGTRDGSGSAAASSLPTGFSESVVFRGLTHPTAIRFAPDGRVFVAEQSGRIKVFDSLADTSPTVFADLRTQVYNFWDRGLLGMALDPAFPANPYVYVLYAYDAEIGGAAPLWGSPGVSADPCPTPPGPTDDGCVISGRLSRLKANGNKMTGPEHVLINDWCQQYPSHSVGDLAFGKGGALYVSGGDGASFTDTDYGQFAGNPCGDPPAGPGGDETAPTAEGGALRSQSPRRAAGEPRVLDGAILRVSPSTGDGLPNNPLATSSDANARRIVAYGLRNPFRFVVRPGTTELWIGDVGLGTAEEIDRVVNPIKPPVENLGWPCYEGYNPQPSYQAAGLDICNGLYGQPGAVTAPFFRYTHAAQVVPGESCPTGSSSVSGLAFYPSAGPYPAQYRGALFFADHSRNCIWAMQRAGSAIPSPSHIKTFVAPAAHPVDLQVGPDGNLYYVDYDGGTVRKITYTGG